MGHATAEAVVRAGLTLVPFSFTGESGGVAVSNIGVSGIPVEIVPPQERQHALESIQNQYSNLVVVDYTLPSAVNGTGIDGAQQMPLHHTIAHPGNARFYCDNKVPFVMGTTGGDVEQMYEDVTRSGTYAVIAPNMGKQVCHHVCHSFHTTSTTYCRSWRFRR